MTLQERLREENSTPKSRNGTSGSMLSSLRIVTVSALKLDRSNIFYFSTFGPVSMLWLPSTHSLRSSISMREWFVMELIPEEAIIDETQTQFLIQRRQGRSPTSIHSFLRRH